VLYVNFIYVYTIMDDSSDLQQNSLAAANQAVADVIYTTIFDVANEIISTMEGADQEKILEAATNVLNRYVEGGLKVRKKPSPRPRVSKAPAQDKPVNIIKAASKKMHNSLTSHFEWLKHPDSDNLSYTTSVKLATGYPVRDNASQKIVSVVTEDATVPLTVNDARIALSYGLDVGFDQVEQ